MTTFMNTRLRQAVAPRGRLARAIVAAVSVGLFSTACDVHGVSGPGTLATLQITPNPQTLAINATQQFTVVGKDFSGAVVSVTPAWTVAAAGGAISASGLFTAGTVPGTFANTITASSNGKTATATVIVTPGPLASITLTPTPVSLATGATQQYVAVGKDASGNIVAFTPTWSVIAGGGSVSSTGLFTAGTVAGAFPNTVQASNNGITATGTVTVTPGPLATLVVTPNPITLNVGGTQQYTAAGKDANGNTVVVAPVWTVTAGGGSITAAGLFTAGTTPGAFANTVKATVGSISGTATVNVNAGPLATITVTPNPSTLAAGTTTTFTAVGTDAAGNVIPITPAWSIAAGGGTIDFTTGVFTAGNATGTFANTVRANVGGINGFATVTVTAGAATSITVTPAAATLQTGAAQQYTAILRDAGNNVVAGTVTWSVVNGGGTITSTGLFTAGNAAGAFPATIKATSGALSGTASVTVTPALASITVTPNPSVVIANGTQQFAATGIDGSGANFAITPVWSVVNGGGTIDANTGVFTAGPTAGAFPSTIKATSNGVSGFATVTVTAVPPTLATIVVLPNPAVIPSNGTQQFAATGIDAGGNNFAITPVWSVVNGGGTIDPVTGVFTAGAATGIFTSTVKATSNGVSGFATVTVTAAAPVLTTVTVIPNPATLNTGQTQQFTASGRDQSGAVFIITPVWTVTNPAAGTINAVTGLFTAGNIAGTYTNAVRATSGTKFGEATVIVGNPPVVPVNVLGSASLNGIMAGTAVSCAGPANVGGNVSISPGSTISGPCVVAGVQHLGDPTAALAQVDLTAAYNDLMGRPCPPSNIITSDLGGTTKLPGVYCSPASTMNLTGTLTLNGNGDANSIFVFQVGSGLTVAGNVVLIGGAQASNVYFVVGSSATLGTASQFQGNIVALTSITLVTGTNLNGRALARNGAVTLGTGSTITLP
jgi:hypothetical protein